VSTTNVSTAERLASILTEIEDAPLREELFQTFHLLNPLEFAKLLVALALPDTLKASLLALKVGMPPAYKGVDLEPLVERAMQIMWARLGTAE
jgi:hypothetical protein